MLIKRTAVSVGGLQYSHLHIVTHQGEVPLFIYILICKIDLSMVFFSIYLRGYFNVRINTRTAAQYLQRLQREYENRIFFSFYLSQIKGLEKGFLPRSLHMRRDWVLVSGRRRPGSS